MKNFVSDRYTLLYVRIRCGWFGRDSMSLRTRAKEGRSRRVSLLNDRINIPRGWWADKRHGTSDNSETSARHGRDYSRFSLSYIINTVGYVSPLNPGDPVPCKHLPRISQEALCMEWAKRRARVRVHRSPPINAHTSRAKGRSKKGRTCATSETRKALINDDN